MEGKGTFYKDIVSLRLIDCFKRQTLKLLYDNLSEGPKKKFDRIYTNFDQIKDENIEHAIALCERSIRKDNTDKLLPLHSSKYNVIYNKLMTLVVSLFRCDKENDLYIPRTATSNEGSVTPQMIETLLNGIS